MGKFDHIDDHMLGSYIDGELDTAGQALVLDAMHNDNTTREQIYRLRRAKDLMKLGFENARAATPAAHEFEARGWLPQWSGLAASIVLVISLGAGFLGYQSGKQLAGGSEQVASVPQKQMDRVVLHISESDPRQFASVLAYVRDFLQKHRPQDGEIEVVANAAGLDMLRVGVSPLEEEFTALIHEYDNVHFIACANAIRGLRKKGVEPIFIDNIHTETPAFDYIVGRLQEGWRYVKVTSL